MEWRRIFTSKKTILLSLLLLFATIGIYLYFQFQSTANTSYHFNDKLVYQKELKREIEDLPLEEAKRMVTRRLRAIESQWQENLEKGTYDVKLDYQYEVLQEEKSLIKHLISYPSYLENILNDSNGLSSISIFKKSNSFASKNLEKTRNDYGRMQGTTVSYGQYDGITTVMNYEFAHYSILIFSFLLVWTFFEDEKKGLKSIFYAAPYGRGRLALQRIGILAGSIGVFTVLVYLGLFVAGYSLYGGMDGMGNSIQSIEMFQTYNLPMTVLEYLIYYVLMHAVAAFAVSLFIWMILSLWRNHLLAVAVLILILSGEIVLSRSLKAQSPIAFLKYENMYYMINPTDILGTYHNYMLFGHIVNCFTAFMWMAAVIILVGCGICIRISVTRKTIASASSLEIAVMHVVRKIKSCWHRIIAGFSLVGMELYKILVMHKGILFIGIWLYLLFSSVDTTAGLTMGNSVMMQEVYQEYSGPDDGKLRFYYLEPQENLLAEVDLQYAAALKAYEDEKLDEETLNRISMRYQGYDALRSTVQSVRGQLSYVERVESERGIRVWFLYQKGYKIMMTGDGLYEGAGYGEQQTYALYAVVLLVLLLSTVFSYDRSCNMEKTIYATSYGRNRLFHIKMAIAVLLCSVICVITYGQELYEIQKTYPLSCLEAPVQSLTFMEKMPLNIRIRTFLIGLEVVHFLTLLAISMMVYCLSAYLQEFKSLLAGLLILVGPSVLYLLGIKWCGYISVIQPVIYVEMLQEHGFTYSLAMVLAELVIGMICYGVVKRKVT